MSQLTHILWLKPCLLWNKSLTLTNPLFFNRIISMLTPSIRSLPAVGNAKNGGFCTVPAQNNCCAILQFCYICILFIISLN